MGTQILAGSKAIYIGQSKNWEHRTGKECVVTWDSCAECEMIPVRFTDETSEVRAYRVNLKFTDYRTRDYG